MTREEILLKLEEISAFQSKINNESQMSGSAFNFYSVAVAKVKDLAETIENDHALAIFLWEANLHEAKILATMVEQPEKVTENQLDTQISEVKVCELADLYCEYVVYPTPYVNAKIEEWTKSEAEMTKRAGYVLLWLKARKGDDYTDAEFVKHLEKIRKEISGEQNAIKEAMNFALIGIGSKNRNLNEKALEIANSIGEVFIEPTFNANKAPDARAVLPSDNSMSGLRKIF